MVPAVGPVEAGDQVEHRALAAARRAEHADELAAVDGQRHPVERGGGVRPGAEDLGDRGEGDGWGSVSLAGGFDDADCPVVVDLMVGGATVAFGVWTM